MNSRAAGLVFTNAIVLYNYQCFGLINLSCLIAFDMNSTYMYFNYCDKVFCLTTRSNRLLPTISYAMIVPSGFSIARFVNGFIANIFQYTSTSFTLPYKLSNAAEVDITFSELGAMNSILSSLSCTLLFFISFQRSDHLSYRSMLF